MVRLASPVLQDGTRVQVSRIGVVPKGHTVGRWRLITDLSFPKGHSVNDGVSSNLCSMSYTSVDRLVQVVASFGKGALMAKIDIKSAYRLLAPRTDTYWVAGGKDLSWLTVPSPSGSAQRQRYLMQSLILLSGAVGMMVSPLSTITWTTMLQLAPQYLTSVLLI